MKLETSAVFQWLDDMGSGGPSGFTSSSAGCFTAGSSNGGVCGGDSPASRGGEYNPLRHEVEFVMAVFLGM